MDSRKPWNADRIRWSDFAGAAPRCRRRSTGGGASLLPELERSQRGSRSSGSPGASQSLIRIDLAISLARSGDMPSSVQMLGERRTTALT